MSNQINCEGIPHYTIVCNLLLTATNVPMLCSRQTSDLTQTDLLFLWLQTVWHL